METGKMPGRLTKSGVGVAAGLRRSYGAVAVIRATILVFAIVAVIALASPAGAQGRDPFRSPVSPAAAGETTSAPSTVSAPVPAAPSSSGSLARTGSDVEPPVLAAIALVALGA